MSKTNFKKMSVKEIREKFDNAVDIYSDLNAGQKSAMDSPYMMDLITSVASKVNHNAKNALDIGCGAGNYTLKLLNFLPGINITLIDLSDKMLARAEERIKKVSVSKVMTMQGDIRDIILPEKKYDIVLAATVLHHLRDTKEWEDVFKKIYDSIKPGGSFWITDVILHDNIYINQVVWDKYEKYLFETGGEEFVKKVFYWIEAEDSPRSLNFQTNLLKNTGFDEVEILHKNSAFAAFGGIKHKK